MGVGVGFQTELVEKIAQAQVSNLREATSQYTQSGGQGDPAPNIEESGRTLFLAALEEVRALLPANHAYGGWRSLGHIDLEDLNSLVFGHLAAEDERRDQFLQTESRLTDAFLLVKHLDDCGAMPTR